MWIPIIKTGSYTDAYKSPKLMTEGDLDYMIRNHNPADYQVPVTIGPETSKSPVWAWVKGLKREGNTLYAELTGVVPEFEQMVNRKAFSRHSLELFPDGKLKRIGFPDAAPPKLQGLDNIKFSGRKDSAVYLFSEEKLMGSDSAERLVSLTNQKMLNNPGMTFSEAFGKVQTEQPEATQDYIRDYLTVNTVYH